MNENIENQAATNQPAQTTEPPQNRNTETPTDRSTETPATSLVLAIPPSLPPTPAQPTILTVVEVPPSQTPPRRLRRNGIIARLPKDCRDTINRMIANGVPYKRIVPAVDEFGYTVSERNISSWATGGYLDWLHEQELVSQHRLLQDSILDHVRRQDPSELSEAGLQAAATHISELLLHKTIAGADIEKNLPQYQQLVKTLCNLNREIASLQKTREEREKYLGRFRQHHKDQEEDERQARAIEEVYGQLPPPEPAKQLPPPSAQPQALPPAPAPLPAAQPIAAEPLPAV